MARHIPPEEAASVGHDLPILHKQGDQPLRPWKQQAQIATMAETASFMQNCRAPFSRRMFPLPKLQLMRGTTPWLSRGTPC